MPEVGGAHPAIRIGPSAPCNHALLGLCHLLSMLSHVRLLSLAVSCFHPPQPSLEPSLSRIVDQPKVVGMLGCLAGVVVLHIARVLYVHQRVFVQRRINMVAKEIHSWRSQRGWRCLTTVPLPPGTLKAWCGTERDLY